MPRRSLWSLIKEMNSEERLAVFVGAGISMGCGLPSWEECVKRVLDSEWHNQPQMVEMLRGRGNVFASRYARQKSGVRFNRIVHAALYRDGWQISRCVRAIAKSGIREICNFNFDDLIAEALQEEGVDCRVVAPGEAVSFSDRRSVTVYHPHGILPRFFRASELDELKITFSEDDYHALYSDAYSWSNLVQLSLLTTKSVLFVGLSMQDPNLRRLIDAVRQRGFLNQHIAVLKDPVTGSRGRGREEAVRLRKLIETDMRSLGITSWFVDSYDKIQEIFDVCRV